MTGRRFLYRHVADQLREQIYRGDIAPGAQLPTERELTERYGTSRNTVRLALGLLTNEGLVTSGQGRGYFVRDRAPLRFFASRTDSKDRRDGSKRDAFMTDMAEQGRTGTMRIEVNIARPPQPVAVQLGLEEQAPAVVRRRVQYVDGEPSALADTYYPLDLVQGSDIARPENIERGANRVLEELGHPQVRFLDEITVRMPTAHEAQVLRLSPGTPVAELTRTGYDRDDRPVRVFVTVLPGDTYTLVYEVPGD